MRKAVICGVVAMVLSACGQADEAQDEIAAKATPEPSMAPPRSLAPVDPELIAWLKENYTDMGQVLLLSGETDLDSDGMPEILVYIGGPMLCGTGGCNLVVLRHSHEGLEKIGNLSVTQLPVGVFATSTNGWRDLAVTISGGGIEGGVAEVPFGIDKYAGNPTAPPAALSHDPFETVIADGPLQPLD